MIPTTSTLDDGDRDGFDYKSQGGYGYNFDDKSGKFHTTHKYF